MMKFAKCLVPVAILGLIPIAAMSQVVKGPHPGYLHALTDLRAAHWFLHHQPGDTGVLEDEARALTETDAAFIEIKKASIDDGKDVNVHPNVDVQEHGSRLLKAIESLKQAHSDIDSEESNPEAKDLRVRALNHLDQAIHSAERAHEKWLAEGKK